MKRTFLAATVIGASLMGQTSIAAPPAPLTADEIARAMRVTQESPDLRTVTATLADNVVPDKSFLIDVKAVESSQKDSIARMAIVTRFQYMKRGPGLTLRTTVDLSNDRVVKHETLENYPTPLAPAELAEAVRLARMQQPRVEMLYAAAGDRVVVRPLVAVVANPQHADYGHRIVYLTIEAEGHPSLQGTVAVDLTDGTAELAAR